MRKLQNTTFGKIAPNLCGKSLPFAARTVINTSIANELRQFLYTSEEHFPSLKSSQT
ncbi:hypothetical protein PORCAN_974 [Porphyromonas crevioricanis JCM 13913]|nr:hypothetical protein PORCAN_974 [Porphyromonas crevioricanis JCM 13913]